MTDVFTVAQKPNSLKSLVILHQSSIGLQSPKPNFQIGTVSESVASLILVNCTSPLRDR